MPSLVCMLLEMPVQISHDGSSLKFDFLSAKTPEQERTLVVHRFLAECVLLVEVGDFEFALGVH